MHAQRSWALIGHSILIVEDEPLIALDVHAALSAAGASVIAATDLADAEDLARNAEVSAGVLDINFSGRDCSMVCAGGKGWRLELATAQAPSSAGSGALSNV